MIEELTALLKLAFDSKLRELEAFRGLPRELLELKEVALSGNGEPTLCPNFAEVLRRVSHVRSQGTFPFFKIVLITNTGGLSRPEVREALGLLDSRDEIWAKLDAGTQGYMEQINRPDIRLKEVTANILSVATERPVVIQSLFPLVNGQEPPAEEIDQYVERLRELKNAGARISLVQIYSAHRPPHRPDCSHLPLKSLYNIARQVREATGLRVEVF
jgi:wyosine [tRNA(Phe)-imidazoG37] synthetase (radical SAM superfamily)